ncbi:MAG: penicillin-insensitive murein endopeptidase [Myxococcota bacterium]
MEFVAVRAFVIWKTILLPRLLSAGGLVVILVGSLLMARPVASQSPSISVGRTNRGALVDGVQLENSEAVRVKRSSRATAWGTAEMVQLVNDAAAQVAERHPGSRLLVGDISRRRGGRIRPHRSHRAGRDVDIGFFYQNTDEQQIEVDRFIDVGRNGRATDPRGTVHVFDVARNWDVLEGLVSSDTVPVQYVFVASYLRDALLEEGERRGVDPAILERARAVTERRTRSESHRSHFHVRIYCAPEDRPRCTDEPPFHSWFQGNTDDALRAAVAASRARGERRRARDRRMQQRVRAQRTREAQRRRQARMRRQARRQRQAQREAELRRRRARARARQRARAQMN